MAAFSKGMRQRVLLAAALLHIPTCSCSTSRSRASTSTRACCFGRCWTARRRRPDDAVQHAPLRHGREAVLARRDPVGRTRRRRARVADPIAPAPTRSRRLFVRVTEQEDFCRSRGDPRRDAARMTPCSAISRPLYTPLLPRAVRFRRVLRGGRRVVHADDSRHLRGLVALGLLLRRCSWRGTARSSARRLPSRTQALRRPTRLSDRAADVDRGLRHGPLSHSLFPDETDFRVLMAAARRAADRLRRQAAALALFAGCVHR